MTLFTGCKCFDRRGVMYIWDCIFCGAWSRGLATQDATMLFLFKCTCCMLSEVTRALETKPNSSFEVLLPMLTTSANAFADSCPGGIHAVLASQLRRWAALTSDALKQHEAGSDCHAPLQLQQQKQGPSGFD